MLFGKSKAGGTCSNHSPGNLAAQKIREKETIFFSVMTSGTRMYPKVPGQYL